MLCPGCGSEYEEPLAECEVCGAGLAGGGTSDEAQADVLRRVHIAESLPDANDVKDALEAQGFIATVRVDLADDADEPDPEARPSVWVLESQAEKAIRLIIAHQGEPGADPDWACPGCGEEIEGQFTECWQCGTSRPLS
jgi:hypothetical protein